jgi:hypothetical protein
MHLLRKASIPMAGVAVIALAVLMVGPRAVRAIGTVAPTSSFSATAVRYPWTVICNFNNVSFTLVHTQKCEYLDPLPPGAVFVIQTITKQFSISPHHRYHKSLSLHYRRRARIRVDRIYYRANKVHPTGQFAWDRFQFPWERSDDALRRPRCCAHG